MPTSRRLAGPAYLSGTHADILTGGGGGNLQIRTVITRIRLANTDNSAHQVSIWLGADSGTAGGTELLKTFNVAANTTTEIPCRFTMIWSDYLVGGCDTGSVVTCTVEGYEIAYKSVNTP